MNILFYSPIRLNSGGGCERWHCDVTNSLRDKFGHNVEIVTGNLGHQNWKEDYLKKQLNGVPYVIANFRIFGGALIPTVGSIRLLYQKFRWADCVHAIHGFVGQDLLLLSLKLITKKKVYLGWHSPIFHRNLIHNLYMKCVSRLLVNRFTGHMTLNREDKKYLSHKWKVKNVHFIPSGIKTEMFCKVKRTSGHKKLNFVSVGHYRHQKGIDLCLKGIAMFNALITDNSAYFRFAGDGEYKQMIEHYANLHPNIQNVGFVEYESLPHLYGLSDVYLLTSRKEPFGLVLIEAWASGMPVLATKTEGPLDMLKENQNGWFIDQITPESIAKGIEKLYRKWLKNPDCFISMEKKCRQTGEKYSINVTAHRMNRSLFAL